MLADISSRESFSPTHSNLSDIYGLRISLLSFHGPRYTLSTTLFRPPKASQSVPHHGMNPAKIAVELLLLH